MKSMNLLFFGLDSDPALILEHEDWHVHPIYQIGALQWSGSLWHKRAGVAIIRVEQFAYEVERC